MKRFMIAIALFACFALYGCEYAEDPAETSPGTDASLTTPESSQAAMPETPSHSDVTPPDAKTETASESGDGNNEIPKTDAFDDDDDDDDIDDDDDDDIDDDDDDEAEYVEKKAKAGVTHKGEFAQSSEHPMSIVTVPLATYFSAKEKSVFDIQIPSAMNLYKATNGEFPKTEEVFMKEIIEANQIQLPELKEGDEYFYDPDSAELMVRAKK